eukprot:gnl/TRDRNA2_/TRDRNA2_150804_c0_seq1.p1 gnl/TRDRNA2_/TRDRNA2_150804_c0~~gnl/TRDRNA2_/TRDRNA2_150804_c0_seq1.p1  ORF type:complete len:518 (+),score=48.27 gnl/TRDRNA2_/TRDRNA2_150804_c0_seq1:59-1612(+)
MNQTLSEKSQLSKPHRGHGTLANEEPAVQLSEVVESVGLRLIHMRLLFAHVVITFTASSSLSIIPYTFAGLQRDYGVSKEVAGSAMSATMVGAVIGVLAFGRLNDKLGRWKSIMIETSLILLLSPLHLVIQTGQHWFSAVIGLRFLIGAPYAGLSLLSVIHIIEFCPSPARGLVSSISIMGWNLGELYVITLAEHCRDNWRLLCCAPIPPCVVLMLCMLTLHESPRWLLVAGHRKEAKAAVEAVFSSRLLWDLGVTPTITRTPGNMVISEARDANRTPDKTLSQQLGEVFGKKLRRTTMLATVMFFLTSAADSFFTFAPTILKEKVADGTIPYAIMNLGVLGSLTGLVATAFWLDYIGRLGSLLLGIFIYVVSLIMIARVHAYSALSASYMTLNFSSCVVWGSLSVYVMETFPTDARGLGYSIALLGSRLAWITMPIVYGAVLDGPGIGAVGSAECTLYTSAALSVVAAMVSLTVPKDTSGEKMQDTLALTQRTEDPWLTSRSSHVLHTARGGQRWA